ncbi:MAG: hypothetical protein K2R93_12440 [Gemmatimonadaceae bacterium]|nr:hypothetical protein [Gemmatimonadaceae bacterium]
MSDAGTLSNLEHAWPLPSEVTFIDVNAYWHQGTRVHLAICYADKAGHVLQHYRARCGSHLWHELLLPALRSHCAQNGLRCDVHDTTAPAVHPRPKPRAHG